MIHKSEFLHSPLQSAQVYGLFSPAPLFNHRQFECIRTTPAIPDTPKRITDSSADIAGSTPRHTKPARATK